MKINLLHVLGVAAAGCALCATASAQMSATTDPVGYAQISCLANSDTRISIPFTRPAEFTGTISAVSSPAGSTTATITVAASPNWQNNQFVYTPTTQPKTYYAIIGPNLSTMSGTVAVTNGSTAVTGSGTTFMAQLSAGDAILVNGTQATVASVTSDTALTLVSNFIGTTASGASAQSDRSKREGSYYTVTANGSNTLTIALNGDSLSTLTSNVGNTSVTLIPYWTLGTAFPASDSNVSYTPSASSKSRGTQLLLPDLVSAGINLVPSSTYYFLTSSSHWYSAADSANSADDTILIPTTHIIVRNVGNVTTFTPVGSVYMNRLIAPLDTLSNSQQDNALAVVRPANVTLNDLGLIASGAFVPSPNSKARTDQLFVYDNSVPGINKVPSETYYYLSTGGWRSASDPNTDIGSTASIPYGSALMIRKAAATNGATSFWQNSRNY